MTVKTEQDVFLAIEDALELSHGSIEFTSEATNIDGWDSLGHLGVLVALDNLFDGKVVDINEVAQADSVPKILGILKTHALL